MLDIAASLSKELKGQDADIILSIAHLDYVQDMELMQSGLFDVILSGYDHYYIAWDNRKSVWIDSGEDAEKVRLMNVHMKS